MDRQTELAAVGIRELRNSVSALVRRAGGGERIVITVDGKPAAQLGPLEADGNGMTLADLAAAGLIEPPAQAPDPAMPPPLPVPADVRLDRLVDQIRGR
ncbi:MAG: type II toxin-antitoxin system prevent-host-death family antitoxin [Actinomycetota bacterium]